MKLYIKNMVCPRCITAVVEELDRLQIPTSSVELGEVNLKVENLNDETKKEFAHNLSKIGFELIDDNASMVVEKIKTLIIDYIHHKKDNLNIKFSEYLIDKLGLGYGYISNLFASVEGSTIEQYLIKQKIERVKELLYYNELSLSEISYQLQYSSVAHLSSQFKKITGMTPSSFRKLRDVKTRIKLDDI